jgi:hypothetical protein
MMAFERTPPSTAALDSSIVAELRTALSKSLQVGDYGSDLRDLLKRAAADSRKRGMMAEQLLLALKDVWYSLPELSQQPGSEVQTRLLQQLIARCIQEYYAT